MYLNSIKQIEKAYYTGEEPVLVLCSDWNAYVCKYNRYSGSANKLACEWIGVQIASKYGLNVPPFRLVKVKREHVMASMSPSFFVRTCVGSRLLDSVIDVTPSSNMGFSSSKRLLLDLLNIALFDIWVSNEDRNNNNSNLMYDMNQNRFVPIDFGCIFNTATFDFPLSELTYNDTILQSALFQKIRGNMNVDCVRGEVALLLENLKSMSAKVNAASLMKTLPEDWCINKKQIAKKINELFTQNWMNRVEQTFMNYLMDNMNNEK